VTLLFWLCIAVILYVYAGYPVLLASGLLGRCRRIRREGWEPFVSVIVPARNEERSIAGKLENLLALDYPRQKLEILVGNDASSDGTASLVRGFENPAIHLIDCQNRQGKSAMQNLLVARAQGEILAFTDADCLLPSSALRRIVENMADPRVGLATNCAVITNEQETAIAKNEGLYWRYEAWLRRQESDRGLLAMASGSLFAMRRILWRALDPSLGDDFVLPLHVARSGYRNVLETRISARTTLGQSRPHSMLRMKMRIISKDFRGLLKNADCLNPFKSGRVAIALWSHKLLRWAIPYFMLAAFVANLFLLRDSFYAFLFALQILFYSLSIAGLLLESREIRFPLSVISSLCLVNFAALLGTLHCFSRRTAGQWETVR
jgi:cellulose synthase/poly-beta-1,6-N-acetylglucosamine synthase-like glycosyltransferase